MINSLSNILGKKLPPDWIISELGNGKITVRDSNIPKGKGYNLTIQEEFSYFEMKVDFEDYARSLCDLAGQRLAERDNPIQMISDLRENVVFLRYREFVEDLLKTSKEYSEKWWLVLKFSKDPNDKYSSENFTDLLLAFIFFLFPYEVDSEEEGASKSATLTLYERSRYNRALCLAFHGYDCKACGINLMEQYGAVARNFIEVHHINPISGSGQTQPDPIRDLVPLCPNCHGIAHRKNPPYTIDEIKKMLIKSDD